MKSNSGTQRFDSGGIDFGAQTLKLVGSGAAALGLMPLVTPSIAKA